MKRKELQTHKAKSVAELEKEIREARARLRALREDLVQGKVKNIREIRAVRRTIAQLLTIERSQPKELTHGRT